MTGIDGVFHLAAVVGFPACFDLIVNQFVLEALTKRKLVIYQGDYKRSFIHVGMWSTRWSGSPRRRMRGSATRSSTWRLRVGTTRRWRWSSSSASTCPPSRWSIAIGAWGKICLTRRSRARRSSGCSGSGHADPSRRRRRRSGMRSTVGLIRDPGSSQYRNHQLIVN
jgi:hypothetical protein